MGMLALICLLPLALGLTPRQKSDRITQLPGLNFESYVDQYSGYLNASRTGGKFLHYWLIESQGNPTTDPVLVWFNGGPGCSSMTGAMYENGPFHVNQGGRTLWENVHAWNKLGSVLYVEGPTGVGFSYASDPAVERQHTDDTASMEFYLALDDFFANVRPDLQSNDLYITGESYAGVYIPTVTQRLVDNAATFKGNLKGMAIGNGLLSERLQHNSVVDFLYFHGIIGIEYIYWTDTDTCQRQDLRMWEDLHKCCNSTCTANCDFYSFLGGTSSKTEDPVPKNSTCGRLVYLSAMMPVYFVSETLTGQTDNDRYNIYKDCYNSPQVRVTLQRSTGMWRRATNNADYLNYDSTDNDNGFSCWGQDMMKGYLNRPELWEAFHIRKELTDRPDFKWRSCNKIMTYNGDVDLACNFLGDQWFMTAFARKQGMDKLLTSKPRYPWMYRGQIGGYVKSYGRVDVATVKGSGHFVPTNRPGPMLQLLANFIRNSGNYSLPTNVDLSPAPLLHPRMQTSGAPSTFASFILVSLALALFL